jgi:hypothetical protein
VAVADASTALGDDADVKMDTAGNATALWVAPDQRLRTVSRPAGGTFGPVQVIGDSTGATAGPLAGLQGASFAVDGAGEAVVAWSGADGGERVILRGPDGV